MQINIKKISKKFEIVNMDCKRDLTGWVLPRSGSDLDKQKPFIHKGTQ